MRKLRCSATLALVLAVSLLPASRAEAASWAYGNYLYRYVFWGAGHLISPSDDYERFPYHTVDNGPSSFRFTPGDRNSVPATVEYQDGDVVKHVALERLLRSTGTTTFIITKDDKLLYEAYLNGFQRDSVCISRSVGKSFISALVGIAIDEGFIKGVDDPIRKYLPELRGRGFGAITIRHLLTMGSGIKYDISNLPWDDQAFALYYPDLRDFLLSDLKIVEPPGQSFHYNDYNTLLVGMILERATHVTPAKYLQEKIWKPLGMEYPATWSIDSIDDALELAPFALNARAIDFAKFGRLYLRKGNWNGKQTVPEHWVLESTTRDRDDHRHWETFFPSWPDMGGYYKYFWWGLSRRDGDYSFTALGAFGQYIFVSPKTGVVIVRTGPRPGIDPILWPQIFRYIADHIQETP